MPEQAAPDAAGDSLHVGINGQPVDTVTSLTGFGREWGWSRLMEMVEDVVESVTTYGPYGNLLAQAGNDEPVAGTNYGYTGEQHDASTGLLYLRARYYNPALRSFMGRDPWSGNGGRPQSMNGWSYVDNNPINFIDLTGFNREAKECRTNSKSKRRYVECVADAYNVDPPFTKLEAILIEAGIETRESLGVPMNTVKGQSNCYWGIIPYRGKGYLEGESRVTLLDWEGEEVVYDFASLERQRYDFHGKGVTDSIVGLSRSWYFGRVDGFRSWNKNQNNGEIRLDAINEDYSGKFIGGGMGVGLELVLGVTTGFSYFKGLNDPSISTISWYFGVAASVDILAPEGALAILDYIPVGGHYQTYVNSSKKTVKIVPLLSDILLGADSPSGFTSARILAMGRALKYAAVYENMHNDLSTKP